MTIRPDRWTVRGLLDQFLRIHDGMTDRYFAFILGAGASRPSGIPTGAELVRTWLLELRLRYDQEFNTGQLSNRANEEIFGIKGFDFNRAAEFYPQIFEKRFSGDPEEGYAYLERLMSGREPSFGYSVLASILANTRHQVVITTNFDNLAADALSIYTKTYPLVCAHEDLACFIRPRLRRPLVAKIHRDLFLAPKNDVEGTSRLAQGWDRALRELLQHYAP